MFNATGSIRVREKKVAILPTSHDDKLAYLYAARKHGDAISALSQVGGPAAPLRDYAAAMGELTVTQAAPDALRIGYGDLVEWIVRVDRYDVVEGYAFSGLQDLMAALGIDFSGGPYVAA